MRLCRSISWLKRVQQMGREPNGQAETSILNSSSFGSASMLFMPETPTNFSAARKKTEMGEAEKYFRNLLNFGRDAKGRIYNVIEGNISRQIISLTGNRFVWANFWKYHHDIHKKLYHRLPIRNS